METIMNLLKKYQEIISYLFWGFMTTIVSWGSYSLFVLLFQKQNTENHIWGMQMSMTVLLANVLSWVCAFLFAYITNKLWVFHSKSWSLKVVLPEFGKFFSARALTGLLEIVAVPFLVGVGLNQTIFGIEGIVAKIIVSVAVVILNYVFSKLFIFKKA